MNGQTLVNEVSRKLNGEYEVISEGSDDWNTIISALNEKIDLYNKSALWRTKYNPKYEIGTVSTDEFYPIKLSDIANIYGSDRAYVYFYNADGTIADKYKLTGQDLFDQANTDDKVVALNMNGLQIKPKTATDVIYGTTMVLPVYLAVKPVSKAGDTVTIDDIYWLIVATAADLAAISPVSFIQRNAPGWNKEADNRMKAMKKNNRVTQSSTPAYGGWTPSLRPDGR